MTVRTLMAIFMCSMLFAAPSAGEPFTVSYSLDAGDLENRGQLHNTLYSTDTGGITLTDLVLVEDDAPAIGRPKGANDRSWDEHLTKGIVIRKELVLDDPRALAARLVFEGKEMPQNAEPLHISINGEHIIRPATKIAHPQAIHYYTNDWENWFVVPIPAGALKEGVNEILMWTESAETSWKIMVADEDEYARGSDTRRHHPNRSAKSSDGGKTWDDRRLGWKGVHDGEYCIRLILDRYADEGVYTSPVFDMACTPGPFAIKELATVNRVRLTWDIGLHEGTVAAVSMRIGKSPAQESSEWTVWEDVSGSEARLDNPAGRYVQFRVRFATDNPLATPILRGVMVKTEGEREQSGASIRLVSAENGCVVRTSEPFAWEDFEALAKYREMFELDEVVADALSEFEAQLRLMRWAYEIPIKGLDPYSWDYYDLPVLHRGENGEIELQKDYEGRRRDGHCLNCNLTLIAACVSMGYPARWVNISTKHTYGHEVAEVWSNEYDKWVMLDATRDYYMYDPATGIPLNLVEISDRLAAVMPRPATWDYPIQWSIPNDSTFYDVDVAYREGDNRFTITDVNQGPHLLRLMGHLQMPLRNDFASRHTPVPWRLSSNWGGDGFYCWYGEMFPRKYEYARHTNRPQDFTPPFNQAEVTVSATDDPGVLRVDIDTVTPGFECFEVSADGSAVEEVDGPTTTWRLHEGLNRLMVRARNTMGVTGPPATIEVAVNR